MNDSYPSFFVRHSRAFPLFAIALLSLLSALLMVSIWNARPRGAKA